MRRNKLMVSAAASVAVALVLGLVLSVWQWQRAEKAFAGEARQREAAQSERLRAEEARVIAESRERDARLSAYASDMNLAFQALRENRRSVVQRLLDQHRPRPEESDLRGWEWHYLKREARSDESWSLEVADEEIYGVALSPDGRFLTTALSDLTVKVWDVTLRRAIITLPHEDLQDMAFSPDGQFLLTAANELPEGKGLVRFWQVGDWKRVRTVPYESYSLFGANLAFSPDGAILAVGGRSLSVFPLNRDGAPRVLATGPLEAKRIAFSPRGDLLAVAYTDSTIALLDTHDWKPLKPFAGPGSTPTDHAFSANGLDLAATFKDNRVRVWNTQKTARKRLTKVVPRGKPTEVYSLGGATLLLMDSNRFEVLADIPPSFEASGQLPGTYAPDPTESYFPSSLSVSPSGRRVAYRETTGTHCVLNLESQAEICHMGEPGQWLSLYRAFSPVDSMLTGGDNQDHARIVWSATTGKEIIRRTFEDLPTWSQQWWLSDSRTIMLSVPQGAYLWDVQDNTAWLLAPEGGNLIMAGVLSQDSSQLATFDYAGKVRIWDPRSRQLIHTFEKTEAQTLSAYSLNPFDFSPDGRRLAVVAGSPALKIYDAANWRELVSIDVGARPATCRFSPDGHWLSIGAEDVEDGRRGVIYLDGMPL